MYTSYNTTQNHNASNSWTAEENQALVAQLNDLMEGLHLPISIIAPTDLTPSLLMAVLESLLGEKIPIPQRSAMGKSTSADLKLQKVKVFLGVLETDVIQQPVGLSDLDPRRLADGGCEEASYVAEVLVWIGNRVGLLPRVVRAQKKRKHAAKATPSRTPSEGTSSANTTVSNPRKASARFSSPELDTTSVFYAYTPLESRASSPIPAGTNGGGEWSSSPGKEETPSSVALSLKPPFESPLADLSVELDDRLNHNGHSSLLFANESNGVDDASHDQSYLHQLSRESSFYEHEHSSVSVRYKGYIEPVDEEFEIASYLEHSQVLSPAASSMNGSILGNLSDDDDVDEETVSPFSVIALPLLTMQPTGTQSPCHSRH